MAPPVPVIGAQDNVRSALDAQGAVVVRGTPFDLNGFERFTLQFCQRFHIPATRAAKRQQGGDNYSTEVYRDNYTLFAHAEGTYKPYPAPPEICFFLCVTPPSAPGGETTLFDGVEFYKRMPRDLRERFEKSGVTYEMRWDRQRWQDEFEIADVNTLEALLKTLPSVRYAFEGEELHLFYTTNAITRSRKGLPVFANAMLAHLPRITHPRYEGKGAYCKASNRVYFGTDGEAIGDDIINALIDVQDEIVYPHRWEKGDIVILDNTRWMHGRTLTEYDCERVLVSRFGWFTTGG